MVLKDCVGRLSEVIAVSPIDLLPPQWLHTHYSDVELCLVTGLLMVQYVITQSHDSLMSHSCWMQGYIETDFSVSRPGGRKFLSFY